MFLEVDGMFTKELLDIHLMRKLLSSPASYISYCTIMDLKNSPRDIPHVKSIPVFLQFIPSLKRIFLYCTLAEGLDLYA